MKYVEAERGTFFGQILPSCYRVPVHTPSDLRERMQAASFPFRTPRRVQEAKAGDLR